MSDTWLVGPVTTSAYGWRLERADGVTLGFTSHDRDVELDGLTLRASPGMVPSSIVESLGFEHDGLDLKAALASDAIGKADLMAGRWDGARLNVFLFDWSDPDVGKRDLASGELGAISLSDQGFTAELLGPTRLLDKNVVPMTSPTCRARFCDSACGLSRARFTHLAAVASAEGAAITLADPLPVAPGNLLHGMLRWLDGENCGLSANIIAVSESEIGLIRTPHFAVVAGAMIELVEGCDRQIATCAARFGNATNFRGEPYLPGNDLLTRYPGGA